MGSLWIQTSPESKQAQFAGIPWFQPRECQYIESIRRETGVGLEESEPVIEKIYAGLGVRDFTAEPEELDDMPPRRVQPREPKGTPRGGRWRR